MADVIEMKKPQDTNIHIVKLGKPYIFEQKEYTEIDLSGLEKLTIKDAIHTQGRLIDAQEVAAALLCENTTAFAREIAAKASKMPVEFFKAMPRGAMRKVRTEVVNFINFGKKVKDHIIEFEKPYDFKGERFEKIDLTGVSEINSLQESAAENAMARAGFQVMENTFNFLYACIIAGMATKKPEEFFTGLPLCELVKLKNAVNDASFFE